MKKLVLLTALVVHLSFPLNAREIEWSEIVKNVKDKIVLIEYYEKLVSFEAIEEKSRVKKHLTGVLVDNSGLILTSSDIFRANLEFTSSQSIFTITQEPDDIRVRFEGGQYQPATFIGKDDDKKIAFLKLNKKTDREKLSFSEKPQLTLGSKILIIQHLDASYDFEMMVNERIVNAVIKKPRLKYLCENNIQALSGFGLVLDRSGQAVAIMQNSHPNGQPDFDFPQDNTGEPAEIIPYANFKALLANPPEYKEKETARKKWLGIYMQPFTRKLAGYFNAEDIHGILINTVLKNSPAQRAGLQTGDVIVSINDTDLKAEKFSDLDTFRDIIRHQNDAAVKLRILREDKLITVNVTLGDTPISQFLADEVDNVRIGFSVKELTQDIILAKNLNFDTQGVWVSKVENAGWADVGGLRIGDLILAINEQPISDLKDIGESLESIEKQQPQYISFFIKRNGETRFLFIKTNFEE